MIQEEQQVKITVNDLIYANVQDLGKRMDRLERRMDKIEEKLEKLNEKIDANKKETDAKFDKQNEKIDKLADKIDELRRDLNVGTNHYQILLATLGGVACTVIFFLLKG